VLNGLDPNDDVVVNPSDSIEDGMPVRIAPPKQNKDDGQSGDRKKQGGDQDKQGDKDKQDDKDKKATGEAGDSKTKTAESSL
jgi:hypothetical protein